MKYTVTVDGDVFEIEVGPMGRAWVDQQPYEVDLRQVGRNGNGSLQSQGEYSLLVDHRSYEIHVPDTESGQQWVMVAGRPFRTQVQRGHGQRRRSGLGANGRSSSVGGHCSPWGGPLGPTEVRAPLPGLLLELRVGEGECVEEHQVVAVVESMKMNLEIRAPRDGVVRSLFVVPGRQVAQDEVLAILGPHDQSTES